MTAASPLGATVRLRDLYDEAANAGDYYRLCVAMRYSDEVVEYANQRRYDLFDELTNVELLADLDEAEWADMTRPAHGYRVRHRANPDDLEVHDRIVYARDELDRMAIGRSVPTPPRLRSLVGVLDTAADLAEVSARAWLRAKGDDT